MVKHFDKCLCGNLRTGTIIIGALGLVGGLYYIIAAGLNLNTSSGSGHGGEMPGGVVARIIVGLMGVVNIILCTVLIVGAVKRNAKMIYPWIMVSVVLFVLFVIINVAKGIYECVTGNLAQGLGLLLSVVIGALIQAYCILIVNSFYTNLKNGEPVATQQA